MTQCIWQLDSDSSTDIKKIYRCTQCGIVLQVSTHTIKNRFGGDVLKLLDSTKPCGFVPEIPGLLKMADLVREKLLSKKKKEEPSNG